MPPRRVLQSKGSALCDVTKLISHKVSAQSNYVRKDCIRKAGTDFGHSSIGMRHRLGEFRSLDV
jgi:hypothetical protein